MSAFTCLVKASQSGRAPRPPLCSQESVWCAQAYCTFLGFGAVQRNWVRASCWRLPSLRAPLRVGSLPHFCARDWVCVCSICMYAFVWARVYFSLDPINQVSSTSAITYLARLLFLVSQFYSRLGKFSTFLLILWNALFPGSLYICVHIYIYALCHMHAQSCPILLQSYGW